VRIPAPEGFGMKVITPRRRRWTTVFLGAYLFIAPWLFGTSEDEASSTNAWIVGTLILTLAVTSSLAFDLSSWMHAQKLRYQARRISPGMLLRFGEREEHMHSDQLCRYIVESSCQIRQTLLGQTSRVEVGMCILGYRACVNDSITLNRLIGKEMPESGPFRRLRLEMIRRQASHSLACAREVIPPGVPHTWYRSRP
jgi:hypothetical protein